MLSSLQNKGMLGFLLVLCCFQPYLVSSESRHSTDVRLGGGDKGISFSREKQIRNRVIFPPMMIDLFPLCDQDLSSSQMIKFHRVLRDTISDSIESQVAEANYYGINRYPQFHHVLISDLKAKHRNQCTATLEMGEGVATFLSTDKRNMPVTSNITDWIHRAIRESLLNRLHDTELQFIKAVNIRDKSAQRCHWDTVQKTEPEMDEQEIPSTTMNTNETTKKTTWGIIAISR